MSNLFSTTFKFTLLFLVLAELFSVFAYLCPTFNNIAFLMIIVYFCLICALKFDLAVLILLAELFVGSKGYLFAFEYEGILISIRLGLWLMVMSFWLAKFIARPKQESRKILDFKFAKEYAWLFLFIIIGLFTGYFHGNGLSNIFFDLNGWLFFGLLFPLLHLKNAKFLQNILSCLNASIVWLIAKTYLVLFIFSHHLVSVMDYLYGWVRDSGVGEITLVQDDFYRVFFQSHIYVLFGWFVLLIYLSGKKYNKNNFKYLFYLSALSSVVLLSFSRSFWAGMLAAGIILVIYLLWKKEARRSLNIIKTTILSILLAFCLIIFVVKLPLPGTSTTFNAGLFGSRAAQITGEAAASSRWSLLPELVEEYFEHPVLGGGFGTTVTYRSGDPRVLDQTTDGQYTTYAFEWGWLDILLKIGPLGLLAYVYLLFMLLKSGQSVYSQNKDYIVLASMCGLVMLAAVNMFTPYLNHPLGIGMLLIIGLTIDNKPEPTT